MPNKNKIFLDFSKKLHGKLSKLNCGVEEMELYEFRYALENMKPENNDWVNIKVPGKPAIEELINTKDFYKQIELKPEKNGKIVLDKSILDLNTSLFSGIVNNIYDLRWVDKNFYFDVRGFLFIPRTIYFTDSILNHLREEPYLQFKTRQKSFDNFHGIGFKDFKEANKEIDQNLITIIEKLATEFKDPVVIAIAGPTAAGKTEFTEYLLNSFTEKNKTIVSVEMDNFFHDRDYRESIHSGSMSKEGIHFDLFKKSLINLKNSKSCEIPRYNFTTGFSSHDAENQLKPDALTIKVEPKDVIYIEGNFPFLFDEIIPLIDIKIFYLTDDPIRLKRKWKRDIDYRKKYDSNYLCNRYFRTQFLKAEACYRDQLLTCDVAVDTTKAHIYISKTIENLLE